MHRAIAERAFRAPGPAKTLHDGISGAVYASVAGAATLAGRAAAGAVRDRPVSTTPQGAAALAVLNGLRGDVLEPPLATPMTLRADGEPQPRVAVFVHGLFETEHAWRYGGGPTYGDRLEGFTPIWVRYSTGRHISENGRSLAEALDELVAEWPVERDPEALRAAVCQEVPLLDGAVHCFVAATVTRDARHPVARVIGDWLLLEASASHRAHETLHVGGAHHLALLNHPAVYERLSGWLAPRPA